MRFSEFLQMKKPLLLDGAMGTELQRREVDTSLPLWSARALLSAPHVVRTIHREYLLAGADIITTNTFRPNIRTLRHAGLESRWEDLNVRAVQLAFEARDRYREPRPVIIAGSIAPVEDCYAPELVPSDDLLKAEHTMQANLLARAGVDVLLIETMNTIREARIASEAAFLTGKEYIISFVCTSDGKLISGESLPDAVKEVEKFYPRMIGINCVSAPAMLSVLEKLQCITKLPCGVYANVGTPNPVSGWEMRHDCAVDDYALEAMKWTECGAHLIGGCCGTTPEHISKIHSALLARQNIHEQNIGVSETPSMRV